jgi:CBS domain-containing protein
MIYIDSILKKKGNVIYSVKPGQTVYEALEMLAAEGIGAVLVMEDNKLLGIFSERDYARKLILKGIYSKDALVKDMMSKDVIVVSPNSDIFECMTLMTEKRIRHLPVIENDKVVGIVSIGDIVNTIINSQSEAIKSLESYIHGGAISE